MLFNFLDYPLFFPLVFQLIQIVVQYGHLFDNGLRSVSSHHVPATIVFTIFTKPQNVQSYCEFISLPYLLFHITVIIRTCGVFIILFPVVAPPTSFVIDYTLICWLSSNNHIMEETPPNLPISDEPFVRKRDADWYYQDTTYSLMSDLSVWSDHLMQSAVPYAVQYFRFCRDIENPDRRELDYHLQQDFGFISDREKYPYLQIDQAKFKLTIYMVCKHYLPWTQVLRDFQHHYFLYHNVIMKFFFTFKIFLEVIGQDPIYRNFNWSHSSFPIDSIRLCLRIV